MIRPLVTLGGALVALLHLAAGAAMPQAPDVKKPAALTARWTPTQSLRSFVDWAKSRYPEPPRLEAVEMLTAIARGSDMGPGDGWFHGSQSRYGWEWLKERYDPESVGKILQDDFPGSPEMFQRLDRNHDGQLTSTDFDWGERSAYAMEGMPATNWFRMADADSNGRLSRDEWLALFARAAKDKDYLTPDDLREMFPVRPPPRPANAPPPTRPSGPSPIQLALGVLNGELGSVFEGPRVGQRAPDFKLRTLDGKREIGLADFRGQKPVVLIFGSFT